MPEYTLRYFEARGIGEVSRQLFHLAGVPFTDKRYPLDGFGADEKAKVPFGQLPVLEVNGQQIPQSFAIARYLAKEFGFAGKNAFEQAWVDALADQFKDYYFEFRKFFQVQIGFIKGDRDQTLKDHGEPARDAFCRLLEKRLAESKSGFLVGDGITWIDLQVADHFDVVEGYVPGFYNAFPKVLAHKAKVQSNPAIRAWLERRPKDKF